MANAGVIDFRNSHAGAKCWRNHAGLGLVRVFLQLADPLADGEGLVEPRGASVGILDRGEVVKGFPGQLTDLSPRAFADLGGR